MQKIKNEKWNRLSSERFMQAKKLNAVIILDNVRSAMNVGAAFRTGDAFRIRKMYLCGITAKPPHREINKTALGAQKTVPWEHLTDTPKLIKKLKMEGYQVMAIEQADESSSLLDFKPLKSAPYAFVFGNEVYGVTDEVINMANEILEIPQFGVKRSLNISVSIGVTIWDFVSKLNNPLCPE